MRLLYVVTGGTAEWLAFVAVVFTLGEMVFLCLFIVTLVWFAVRYQHGKSVPDWVPAMVVPAT